MKKNKHVEINLGNVCNNRCIFCMVYDIGKKKFASAENVRRELDYYGKEGFTSLGFLGGEPTIYPNIIDIVRYANHCGFTEIHMVSNGRMFSNKSFLRKLIDSGVTRFSVSIHSHIESVEDSLTRVPGGFKQKIEGIKNLVYLKKRGLIQQPISANIVINKKNIEHLPGTVDFLYKLGITRFRLNFIRPKGRAMKNFDILVPMYSEVVEPINKTLSLTKNRPIKVDIGDIPPCIFSHNYEFINSDGTLKDNTNLVVSFSDVDAEGNIYKNIIYWENQRKYEFKTKGKQCATCKLSALCEGVWKEYADKFGFGEFRPFVK